MPPMIAPVPASPEREPIAPPTPAPSRPPDSARSPGVVPQADNPAAITALRAKVLKVLVFNISRLPYRGLVLERGQKQIVPVFRMRFPAQKQAFRGFHRRFRVNAQV